MVNQAHMQWVWDTNNKRYLDLLAGIVTVSVGHCNPKVNAALKRQLDIVWHMSALFMYPSIGDYVKKLVAKMPGKLKVCLFTNSGSEANDIAMFIARLYTGRFDIVSLRNAYHGMSPYSMGMTCLGSWGSTVPTRFGTHQAMHPGK